MKRRRRRFFTLTRNDVFCIFKLFYLLIIVSALYILKLNLHPESTLEVLLALSQTPLMIEYIFHSTLIVICGGALFSKAF